MRERLSLEHVPFVRGGCQIAGARFERGDPLVYVVFLLRHNDWLVEVGLRTDTTNSVQQQTAHIGCAALQYLSA